MMTNVLIRDCAIALFISFAIATLLAPFVIPFLRRLKVGQTEREDGVASHLKKAGTPTMGGIMILLSLVITSVIFMGRYRRIIPVVILSVGFGIIGLIDDYLKVVMKRSDGLLPKQKMLFQIVVTSIFILYLWIKDPTCLEILIPFSGGFTLTGTVVRIISTVLVYFAVIGTVNGTNFTDGLDGLAASVTAVAAVFLLMASMIRGGLIEPVCSAMLGALLSFLLFNSHPAKVFMGDTGSLALGGFIAGCAYMMQMPLFIVIFGLVYLIEVLSVMIQVTYFKKTGGKRIFKMAPIHHHFELCGWSETRIVTVFTVVTILLCVIAFIAI